MKIKRIQLKNGYKRFHDLTIDLGNDPKRIIALIGPNGCGKSSVLDGLLFHNNAYNAIGNKGVKDYTYHSMSKIPNYDYQNVTMILVQKVRFNIRSIRSTPSNLNTQKSGIEKDFNQLTSNKSFVDKWYEVTF